jgi:hypothetical protein
MKNIASFMAGHAGRIWQSPDSIRVKAEFPDARNRRENISSGTLFWGEQ